MNKKWLAILLMISIFLSACSVEVSDQLAATLAATDVSESPTTEGNNQGHASPTPEANKPAVEGELHWQELALEGMLYYVGFKADRPNLLTLDLSDGEENTVFVPPENAWLSEVAASPDGSQLLLAYGPPPEAGQVQFGFTDLYVMPADGSAEPQPLLTRADPSETYFNISWPVEDWVYYAHFTPLADDDGIITYLSQVERLQVASGQVEDLAIGAAWPRVSRDGTLLAYVTDENEFILAAADGTDPKRLLDPALFEAVDAPLFSPDNSLICFSAVEPSTALSSGFWDRLLGVKVASAHSVPSDWYCRPLDGSEAPEQVTHLNAIGLYGDFDPTGQNWAFVSSDGVNMMKADGSELRRLKDIPTTGSVDWVP